MFGKETKGLPEELLKANHDRCVRLPMRGMIRSLNLSNAVAVGTYEVLRQWGYPALTSKGHLTKIPMVKANLKTRGTAQTAVPLLFISRSINCIKRTSSKKLRFCCTAISQRYKA